MERIKRFIMLSAPDDKYLLRSQTKHRIREIKTLLKV